MSPLSRWVPSTQENVSADNDNLNQQWILESGNNESMLILHKRDIRSSNTSLFWWGEVCYSKNSREKQYLEIIIPHEKSLVAIISTSLAISLKDMCLYIAISPVIDIVEVLSNVISEQKELPVNAHLTMPVSDFGTQNASVKLSVSLKGERKRVVPEYCFCSCQYHCVNGF